MRTGNEEGKSMNKGKVVFVLAALSGGVVADSDLIEDSLSTSRRVMDGPSILDRPEFNERSGPAVVVPVQPSDTGSSYIGNDAIHTPKMDCYRSAVGGALICNAR